MPSVFAFDALYLHYHQWGHGSRVLLCFHGIGQDGRVFAPFGDSLASFFTIYSFDLFYHGQSSGINGSVYADHEALTPDRWAQLLDAFLTEHQIDQVSVAGFSMGGVFALATAERFAHRMERLWLLAPDGISTNGWYAFATGSGLGRMLFRYFLNHLHLLRSLSDTLVRLGWLDRSLVRFAQSTLATPAQRERVYRSWIGFRPLRPHLDTLAGVLNQSAMRVTMYLGEYDRVLPKTAVEPLLRRVPAAEVIVLPVGHNRLLEAIAKRIDERLG
ncbi:alpha/beta fold hydrolase [Rudanella paleaurantiibacter]|uniref:Alpha/beta fold hydrolase n=1 Tax=Rudanella paleaurantiibacter TaxID=2614655 RepID=A0A7J5U364_9BACT|nr:alpha/beta hydrolase [Rudanella paleaurantiibacter]KAB7732131.1 alpha/beta fold hydrolase [Rudanella paleaurantiibacter]